MMFTFNNNPVDRLLCKINNEILEPLQRVRWLMGKRKKVECHICGNVLDSWKDSYAPEQCGWFRINKYMWICHRCWGHRNFRPFIEMIDEADRKAWEEIKKAEEIENGND